MMPIRNQINIPNNIYSYFFAQLKAYHNFRNRFIIMYEGGQNFPNFIQNEFYLIDRKWIKKWKKYTGYNDISHALNKSRELVDNDYFWVEPIMIKNMNENELPPLFNQNIYHGNQINPLADFVIIDKACYNLFIQRNQQNILYEISYPLKFFKEKLILFLANNIIFILYKDKQKNFNYELLLLIPKENPNINIIIDEIGKIDFNQWLKINNYDLNTTEEKDIFYYGYNLKIINKTLKLSKQGSQTTIKNTIKPQLNEKIENSLDKKIKLSNPLIKEMETEVKNNLNKTKVGRQFENPLNPNSNQKKAGLQNLGQTCYMNSTLQCLSNIYDLTNHLLKRYGTYDIEKQPLTVAYSSLLSNLFNSKEQYIVPSTFKEIIGILNPMFEGNHAADAKDLLFFLIEKLHQELNTLKSNQSENTPIDFAQQEEDSKNESTMLTSFLNDFNSNYNSKLSQIFYGITRSKMKCHNCQIEKFSFQTFNLLIFQLKKIKEQAMVFNRNLNLYDAFNVEQKEEILNGENMIYCNDCHGLREAMHQQKIFGLPLVLIIILNRGKDNKDFNEQFDIPLILDFTDKNIVINQQSCKKYFLCGVITHLGESGSSGHFIAYCKNNPNSKFTLYNDAIVTPINNDEDAIRTTTSINDFERRTPYILFYHFLNN